ncbi:MAG: hypothetical protein RLY93_11595 [Sumerlaeia bacterium]
MSAMDPDQEPETTANKYEIRLGDEGPVDWTKALEELSTAEPDAEPEPAAKQPAPQPEPAKAPSKPQAALPTPQRPLTAEEKADKDERRRKYEEICKKPSMTMKDDDKLVFDELSDILSHVNTAANKLEVFKKKYPYLVAPNIFGIWEDNLKETATVMFREFHNLRNGQQKKTYSKRYVCSQCKTVCMVPLPGGICDECRSRNAPSRGPESQ